MNAEPTLPTGGNLEPNQLPPQAEDHQQTVAPNGATPAIQKYFMAKILLVAAAVLLLAGGGYTIYYLSMAMRANRVVTQDIPHLTLPNQPKQSSDQFSTQYFTSGYVNYRPTKFKTASIVLPKVSSTIPVTSTTPGSQVIFMSNIAYTGADNFRQLLMYDLSTQKTYVVAQDNSVGGYSNARIMSNHFVVYVSESQTDPLTSTTSIKATDLMTGVTQTVMQDKASNLPASVCCAVSPDGLRLVVPQDGKFLVYQAGEAQPATFPADVKVFPSVEGDDNNQYAAAQRVYGYPALVWLDDNTFMYAKSHPLKWSVDRQGSHASTNKNGLAIYDLTSGKSNDVARTDAMSVKWFITDGKSVIFAGYLPNVSGVVDNNSGLIIYKIDDYSDPNSQPLELVSQPDYQSTIAYSSSTKQLYIQPTGTIVGTASYGSNRVVQRLNTESGDVSSITINGLGDYPNIEGIIGPDKLIINHSVGTNNDYNIYDVQSATIEHIFSGSSYH